MVFSCAGRDWAGTCSRGTSIRLFPRSTGWKIANRGGRRSACSAWTVQTLNRRCPLLGRVACRPLPERLTVAGIYERACEENGAPGYGLIEAEFLFCFITTKRPNKIVQVGSGVSTAVIQMAAKEAGYKPKIVCIDPFPTEYLIRAARDNLIQLIPKPAQEVDIRLLTDLEAGDLLFVDSTHTVRPGSEVNRIILEVLPRLASGAFVHFHDIFLPYDHQCNVLDTLFFWEESTLLHAFLIHNRRYAIAVCLSMLHHACPEKLQLLLPNYRPALLKDGLSATGGDPGHFPTAAYLCVRA